MSEVHGAWYRAPIVWLGAGVLCASIVGCVLLIALVARYPDPPIALERETVLKLPESRDAVP